MAVEAVFAQPDEWVVVQEMLGGGELFEIVLNRGPGRPEAVKRHPHFPMEIHFVCRFCMGVQGA